MGRNSGQDKGGTWDTVMGMGWSIPQTGVLGHRHGISMDTCARNQVVQRKDVNIRLSKVSKSASQVKAGLKYRLGRSGLVGLVPTQY